MRTTISGSVNCLSIRLDYIPGLQPTSKAFIIRTIADKSIGIKSDRKVFLMELPKDSTPTLTKVVINTNQYLEYLAITSINKVTVWFLETYFAKFILVLYFAIVY